MKSREHLLAEIEMLREINADQLAVIADLTEALSISNEHVIRKRELLWHVVGELDAMYDEPFKQMHDHLQRLPREIQSQIRGINELTTQEVSLIQKLEHFRGAVLNNYPDITTAEIKVCWHLSYHRTNKDIGKLLHISERTVEGHRLSIRKKLGLSSHDNINIVIMKFRENGDEK